MSAEAKTLRSVFAASDPRALMLDLALASGDSQYVADTIAAVERTLGKPSKILASVADRLRGSVHTPQQVLVLEALPGETALPSMRHHRPAVSVRWTSEHIEQGGVRITMPIGAGPGPAQALTMWWVEGGGAKNHAAPLAAARRALDTGEALSIEVKP